MTVEPKLLELVLGRASAGDDPATARVLADMALEQGDARLAAAALDRAFGLTQTMLGSLPIELNFSSNLRWSSTACAFDTFQLVRS